MKSYTVQFNFERHTSGMCPQFKLTQSAIDRRITLACLSINKLIENTLSKTGLESEPTPSPLELDCQILNTSFKQTSDFQMKDDFKCMYFNISECVL